MTCPLCITSMKFMPILLVIGTPCDLSGIVRSRRFPPFRLRRRRESSTLCTQGPARGPFFILAQVCGKRAHEASVLKSRRHVLVFGGELHSSCKSHCLHQRREVLVEVGLRIRLKRGVAEMTL